jgi:hypothetical protein
MLPGTPYRMAAVSEVPGSGDTMLNSSVGSGFGLPQTYRLQGQKPKTKADPAKPKKADPAKPQRLTPRSPTGFMLLETKGVVHMALLFGSTWVVNSIVFFAILVMILLSNLFVLAWKPRALWPYYLLLSAALLVNAIVPMSYFLNLPGTAKIVASCAVVFVPIFFAGVIFATTFGESRHPDIDFGSNIAGVILGGLTENFSMMVGFDHLLLVAVAFYFFSAILGNRLPKTGSVPGV